MARKIPVGATHCSCPVCGHKFDRPLTDAEYRNDLPIHGLSEKHKRRVASNLQSGVQSHPKLNPGRFPGYPAI
jgi:hypothetical protein